MQSRSGNLVTVKNFADNQKIPAAIRSQLATWISIYPRLELPCDINLIHVAGEAVFSHSPQILSIVALCLVQLHNPLINTEEHPAPI